MEKVTSSTHLALEPAAEPVAVTTVQPVPFNYFLAIAISVVLTFMLGGAFGTVVMFASMMARHAVPDQAVSANKIQTGRGKDRRVVKSGSFSAGCERG